MGAGFALFLSAAQAQRSVEVLRGQGFTATLAGVVEAGNKELLIEPLGLRYAADELQLR
jgi:phosphoribosylformylglycinamidine cyclo-ligase